MINRLLGVVIFITLFLTTASAQEQNTIRPLDKWKFGVYVAPTLGVTEVYEGTSFAFAGGGVRAAYHISSIMDLQIGFKYYETYAKRTNDGSLETNSGNPYTITKSTIHYYEVPIQLWFHAKKNGRAIIPYTGMGFSVCVPFLEEGEKTSINRYTILDREKFLKSNDFNRRIYVNMTLGNEVYIYKRLGLFLEAEFNFCITEDYSAYHHKATAGANFGIIF